MKTIIASGILVAGLLANTFLDHVLTRIDQKKSVQMAVDASNEMMKGLNEIISKD